MTHKESALEYLRLVTGGKIREAYAAFISPNFRHHNAYFPGDRQSLLEGMEGNQANFPDKLFKVHRAIAEGDLVSVHSHVTLLPGQLELATVHIFRFEGDLIAEMWDLGQQIPEDSPNQNGMF